MTVTMGEWLSTDRRAATAANEYRSISDFPKLFLTAG
jgi:hypothetical protein